MSDSEDNADLEPEPPPPSGRAYHEERDANPKIIVSVGASLLLSLVLIGVIVGGTRSCYSEGKNIPSLKHVFEQVHHRRRVQPGIEIHPRETVRRVEAQNQTIIHNYMWLGSDHKFAQIPVDRAIEIALDAGFPKEAPEASDAGSTDASGPAPQ